MDFKAEKLNDDELDIITGGYCSEEAKAWYEKYEDVIKARLRAAVDESWVSTAEELWYTIVYTFTGTRNFYELEDMKNAVSFFGIDISDLV